MRLWVIRLLLALMMPVIAAAHAQLGKPDALPPVTGGRMAPEPGGKPPLPPGGGAGDAAAPRAPAAPQENGRTAPRCAQPIANNCLSQQSACQVACPPMWSMNPSAPAFTPTDRAGCMNQCMQRYLSCMRLYNRM